MLLFQNIQPNKIVRKEPVEMYKLIICVCRAEYSDDVDNVIGCDNENCPYVWLHVKCAGIRQLS
jgi:hypothetical protein